MCPTAIPLPMTFDAELGKRLPEGDNAELGKKLAGEKAAEFVKDGMVVGLGTGSTAYYTIKKVGQMVADGMEIVAIPTSIWTEKLAMECEIPLSSLAEHPVVDLTIDGADEIDPNLDLIKGMGGALLREKVVASVSKEEIIIADDSKLVAALGTKSALPVEIVPFARQVVEDAIRDMCQSFELRPGEGGRPYITDNGNYILDCRFEKIENAGELDRALNCIPGVVENGLFVGLTSKAVIGLADGVKMLDKD